MGKDKSLLMIEGKRVIEQILSKFKIISDKTMIIANEQSKYQFLDVNIYGDRYQNKGPLAGIESALYYADSDYVLLSACDTPFISINIYKYLINICKKDPNLDAVVPKINDQIHPLSGIYHKRILKEVQHCLIHDDLRVISFFERINYKMVEKFPSIKEEELDLHFFNMNHPHEYKWAKNLNYKF